MRPNIKSSIAAVLLIASAAGTARTLAASSPDCERWVRQYRASLAHGGSAVKHRVTKAAHALGMPEKSTAQYLHTAHAVRTPHLSPAEMLRRFKVVCGADLPSDSITTEFVPSDTETAMVPQVDTPEFTPATMTTESFTPSSTQTATATLPTLPTHPSYPVDTFPVTPIVPIGTLPVYPVQPLPPVPEPTPFALVLTGMGLAAFMGGRRK